MFQNIIGQNTTINLLKNDILMDSLTNSMIFHGKNFTGKLSTALELTRILNCKNDKQLLCNCDNCRVIKELNFNGMIFLSRRDFSALLKEYINCYKKNNDSIYLDSIREIINLTSLTLMDYLIKDCFNDNDKKIFYNSTDKLNDIIYNENISINELENILDIFEIIQLKYKKLNIPVNMLRAMLDWTYISQPDLKRVVIIDHFDHFEKSSQNILLKRLEEPSKNLYFILIAENKNKILNTILSRCRSYYFQKLNDNTSKIIINKLFNADTDFKSLEEYLYRDYDISKKNIFPILIKLLNLVFLKNNPFSELSLFLNAYKDRKIVKHILYELGILLEKEISLREIGISKESDLKMIKNISILDLKLINNIIKKKYNIIETYNLNSVLLLEGIFYPLKAMVKNDKI